MTLTREEILAMKPGRELDALVAKEIMGWTEFSPIDEDVEFSVGVNGFRRNYAIDPADGKNKPLPLYSEDISAAWGLLEQFKQYTVMKSVGWEKEYDCRIWVGITGDQWSVQAKTAPEAICKTALLALLDL